MMKEIDDTYSDEERGLIAAQSVNKYRQDEDWQTCVSEYQRLKAEPRYSDVAKAHMALDGAFAYYKLRDEKEMRHCCKAYMYFYEKRSEAERSKVYEDILAETYIDEAFALVAAMLMDAELREGEFYSFEQYFYQLSWGDASAEYLAPYEIRLLTIAKESAYDRHFTEMIESLFRPNFVGAVLERFYKENDLSEYPDILREFKEAAQLRMAYYRSIFKREAFEEYKDFVSDEIIFAKEVAG